MRTWRGDAPPITTELREETCRLRLLLRPPLVQNWPYHDLELMHTGLKMYFSFFGISFEKFFGGLFSLTS